MYKTKMDKLIEQIGWSEFFGYINKMTVKELTKISGIGSTLAYRIYHTKPFWTGFGNPKHYQDYWDTDLEQVKGIGRSKWVSIMRYVFKQVNLLQGGLIHG